jgi:hypothetical protein
MRNYQSEEMAYRMGKKSLPDIHLTEETPKEQVIQSINGK